VVSTSNIKEANLITGLMEGKAIIKIQIIGYMVEFGEIKQSVQPIEKFVCVEVYRPILDFSSSGKTVELRAKNQLSEGDYDMAVAEIDLGVVAGKDKDATYNRVYIDGAAFSADKSTIDYVYQNDSESGKMSYVASLNTQTNKLTITVNSIPSNADIGVQSIVLFASDFYLEESCNLNMVKEDYEPITYTIYLNIIKTSSISDINISSLKLEKTEQITEIISGKETVVNTKTYERVYLDVSKSLSGTNIYKIKTEILPVDAFNKELQYSFVPDLNYSAALVDVSQNDGTVYYSDSEGGTGYIYITPKASNNNSIKVIIPITVADGNSEATAFKVTSLAEIKNQNKHYVITTLSTLELNSPLFDGIAFKGGLYGKLPDETQNATIKLNGCSLFDVISSGAIVKDITLYGDADANGFIANENYGTVQNIDVTTFVINGIYVPILLTAKENAISVGGLIGKNVGQIINCNFAGSIKKSNTVVNVDGIAGDNAGTITNSNIIVANFEYTTETSGRVILNGENYTNGILDPDTNLSGTAFGGTNISTGEKLGGNEYIKNLEFIYGGYRALGSETQKYGVVFYFEAKDPSYQKTLTDYNIIKISDIISSTCSEIKVLALNPDGTNCSFVSISGENIVISGVGEFVLKIYSAHDYTEFETFNMISVYYFSEFGIYDDGKKLENGDTFTILKGGRDVVYSSATATVEGIEIKQNSFSVTFMLNGGSGAKYITGTTFGKHTINAIWGAETVILKVGLSTGYGAIFDELLNNAFCEDGVYNFNLSMKLGTTKIETSASSGAIEPKDSISFNAVITTDIINVSADGTITTPDIIDKDKTIKIKNSNGYDCTSNFNIYVGGAVPVSNSENKFAFEISISLKEAFRHDITFVDQTYTVTI
ncbi:MAG: hypothetical protein IJ358_00170, partial [Clostridia bacterium]|nr:hypothetical protein [Clostridia bacterium]